MHWIFTTLLMISCTNVDAFRHTMTEMDDDSPRDVSGQGAGNRQRYRGV